MANDQLISGLAGLRVAIGAGSWLAPRLTGRLFGLDFAGNPQGPYLARLFGIRDIALAVGTTASSGEDRARWLQIGIVCDLADAAAGALAGRDGSLPRFASVLVTGTAVSAAAMGVAALQAGD